MSALRRHSWFEISTTVISLILFFYVTKKALKPFEKQREKYDIARQKRKALFHRLKIPEMRLTDYEEVIAAEVIHPDDLDVTFDDIGGQDIVIEQLRDTVVLPLCCPEMFEGLSKLMMAPKGVLLYGPPGCGKSLIAKALAKEARARFINVRIASLTDKYYGESEKMVSALFTLAHKIQPAIIFIDEIDAMLRERTSRDHEVTATIKADLMALWDGLATASHVRVMVLGATNRPYDIDAAFLRRMPKKFKIDLPDMHQRQKILRIMLKDVILGMDVSLEEVARLSVGFSGSDLKELCRNAVMVPFQEAYRETVRQHKQETKAMSPVRRVRAVTQQDFVDKIDEFNANRAAEQELRLASFMQATS